MTLIQEATGIMERMPRRKQRMVVDLLKMMTYDSASAVEIMDPRSGSFKRTGKSHFDLPADFDEHFDDMNEEIAEMFMGESA